MSSIKSFLSNDESGSIMVVTMILLVVLTIAVSFVMDMSTVDSNISRNIRIFSNNSNKADSVMQFNTSPEKVNTWLGSSSVLFDISNIKAKVENKDLKVKIDNKDVTLGSSYIQRIESVPAPPSDYKNEFYSLSHIDSPPVNSRTSPKNFNIRRYGVLATSEDKSFNGKVVMEAGYYLIFPKDK